MAYVVVQHLQMDYQSHLAEIFTKYCELPVLTIENGMRIEPNTVFVIPPAYDVVLNGDFLNLNPRGKLPVHHLGIDFFFASLSQNRKNKSNWSRSLRNGYRWNARIEGRQIRRRNHDRPRPENSEI